MTSLPLEIAVTAGNSESSDRVGAPEQAESVWDVIEAIFPHIKADPTGQKALRNLQKTTGWFEPDARAELRIKSPSRGDLIINLDRALAGYAAELIAQMATTPLPKTRSGRGFNANLKDRTPKNDRTPEAPSFQTSAAGVPTEKSKNKEAFQCQ